MESKLSKYLNDWLKVRVEFKSESDAIKAVEQNGNALRYVDKALMIQE